MPLLVNILRIPKQRISVIILAIVLYLTAPFVEWYFYMTELARGSFPPDADSIGIPLFQFTIGWVLGAPVAALLVWFALRDYPGAVSLFAFNQERPAWSAFWTLLFGYLIFQDVAFAVASVQKSQPLDAMQSLLLVYFQLCLRSSVIYSNFFIRKKPLSLSAEA